MRYSSSHLDAQQTLTDGSVGQPRLISAPPSLGTSGAGRATIERAPTTGTGRRDITIVGIRTGAAWCGAILAHPKLSLLTRLTDLRDVVLSCRNTPGAF